MIVAPTKAYHSLFFDSARWAEFDMRPDDVVVATPYKAGTTWTQNIVLHLIHQDLIQRDIWAISPWLEMQLSDWQDIKKILEPQTHRRVIKSHLPFDGLSFDTDAKYIFVGRDPRDIFMSMWTFYTAFGDEFFTAPDDAIFPALPRPPETLQDFWDIWMARGQFDGETDGYPFWSVFHQIQNWWAERHRPNVLYVHFANLKSDPRAEIVRIAEFLEIEVADEMLDKIVDITSFDSMKKNANLIDPESTLAGGATTFFNKGTNGRWSTELRDDQLEVYRQTADRKFGPDCRRWIETGLGGDFAIPQRDGLT